MQISSNTTVMQAGLLVATDKEGRDYCVVVVKGTFAVDIDGQSLLAEKQEPLVYADIHYGDPTETSIKYECDFARFKPRADVIVNGHAYSPTGESEKEVNVTLEVGSFKKQIRVIGDRHWKKGLLGFRRSTPTPFVKMPLVFERAFGGSDHSHKKLKYQDTEMRNPIGVGFHKNPNRKTIKGRSLPNLEHLQTPIRKWSDTPPPVGFGTLGRNWEPRIKHAGTYDDRWLNERFPFLPDDFDDLYFQSAPADQQIPFLKGGEIVRCTNMSSEGKFEFAVPGVEIPIVLRFWNREVKGDPKLDTLIIEPDQRRFMLVWRVAVPIGQKLTNLREVLVGPQPIPRPPRWQAEKMHFKSIAEFIAWKKAANAS